MRSFPYATAATLYTAAGALLLALNLLISHQAIASMQIDPISFAQLHLLCGTLVLVLMLKIIHHRSAPPPLCLMSKKRWLASSLLLIHLLLLSLALSGLDTGSAVLLLIAGYTLTRWLGLWRGAGALPDTGLIAIALTIAATVLITTQAIPASSWCYPLLILLSGIALRLYSLSHRHCRRTLLDTAHNYALTLPLILLLLPSTLPHANLTRTGIELALLSGAITAIALSLCFQASRMPGAKEKQLMPLLLAIFTIVGATLLGKTISLTLLLGLMLIAAAIVLSYRKEKKPPQSDRG